MAENYIKIPSENGSVNISENVIAVIVTAALSDLKGFAGFAAVSGSDLTGFVGKKTSSKGIRVAFDDNIVSIDICMNVKYGHRLSDVAADAQNAASTAVEAMTGIRPVINVHVSGITLEK